MFDKPKMLTQIWSILWITETDRQIDRSLFLSIGHLFVHLIVINKINNLHGQIQITLGNLRNDLSEEGAFRMIIGDTENQISC